MTPSRTPERRILLATLLALVALLLLTGAAREGRYGPKLTGCVTDQVRSVAVLIVDTDEEMQALSIKLRPGHPHNVDAFTVKQDSGMIMMFVRPLRGWRDRERFFQWGHELSHVVCGAWHPQGVRP